MEAQSIFKNISPLDHRYLLANPDVFQGLQEYLSEEANIRYCLAVEIALLKSHVELSFDGDPALMQDAETLFNTVNPEDVYDEEEKTQHNIRALVNVIKRNIGPKLSPFVHLGATSVDILDTAFALRIRDAVQLVVLPLLIEVETRLIELAASESETAQVGRTHGQHAVPITVGFAMAEYVSRLGKAIIEIHKRSGELRGKLSGAVGAYNATSMITDDPEAFEKRCLAYLSIEPSEISTQMVEPEYLLRLLLELNTAFGIIGNLADDLRNLQRSEIDEVREGFTDNQVGSSTMPQKRNPWNSEHVKSLWKAYAPRVLTFFMDQISEHQRDLTNSASSRFVVEYIAGFSAAASRMKKVLGTLFINHERLKSVLEKSGDWVLAEPAYILLSLGGEGDAHEVIRQATLASEKEGISFGDALRREPEAWEIISQNLSRVSGLSTDEFFGNPALYRGLATEKAKNVAAIYSKKMKSLKLRTS
ncbi:MAG: adenylosuccinate lyase [Spirochaetales bacterium]|nr:adenylosuccinate lyase [Spirochaetales bacterium]